MGFKDISKKNHLRNPFNFSDFMNVVLFDGKQVIKSDELSEENIDVSALLSNDISHIFAIDRARDVLMCHKTKHSCTYYGIECQSKIDPDMVIRVPVYDLLKYVNQKKAIKNRIKELNSIKNDLVKRQKQGEQVHTQLVSIQRTLRTLYNTKLHPVVTVVFNHSETRWNKAKVLKDILKYEPYLKEYINDWKIIVVNLMDLDINQFKSLENKEVFGTLQKLYAKKKDIHVLEEAKISNESMVTVLILSNSLHLLELFIKEDYQMCQAVKKFAKEQKRIGKEEGIKQGIKQGIEKGIEKGIEETELRIIIDFMHNQNHSAEDAMTILNISPFKQKKYLLLLNT